MYMTYSQEFKQGISSIWSTQIDKIINDYYIAQELFYASNVPVLFDVSLFDSEIVSFNSDDIWFLIINDRK